MSTNQSFYGFPQGIVGADFFQNLSPSVTVFVVGPTAIYKTIQAAINAAANHGGGIIVPQPGQYTENLNLYSNCHITGLTLADAGGGVIINGTHTPPTSGGFVFNNVQLFGNTAIISSTQAGTAHLVMANSEIFVTNGYTLNLPNWTGKLESFDVNAAVGTADGYVNNTAGAEVDIFSSSVGSGTSNPMIVSGPFYSSGADFFVPVNTHSGTNAELDACYFGGSFTFSGNSTGFITTSHFETGANASITMSSSGNWSISQSVINSSHNPAIAGAGAGTLTLASIAFFSNASVSGSLTLNTSSALIAGEIRANADVGGGAGYTSLTSTNSTTISTGDGTIHMSTANAATNSAWVKIYIGTSAYWIPAWSTNAP
jgi:hypothetical protein